MLDVADREPSFRFAVHGPAITKQTRYYAQVFISQVFAQGLEIPAEGRCGGPEGPPTIGRLGFIQEAEEFDSEIVININKPKRSLPLIVTNDQVRTRSMPEKHGSHVRARYQARMRDATDVRGRKRNAVLMQAAVQYQPRIIAWSMRKMKDDWVKQGHGSAGASTSQYFISLADAGRLLYGSMCLIPAIVKLRARRPEPSHLRDSRSSPSASSSVASLTKYAFCIINWMKLSTSGSTAVMYSLREITMRFENAGSNRVTHFSALLIIKLSR